MTTWNRTEHHQFKLERQLPTMIIAFNKEKLHSWIWQPFEVFHKSYRYPECFEGDKWPVCFLGRSVIYMSNVCEPRIHDRAKLCDIYPNLYLGQYLTCVRLGAVPAWTLAFTRGGLRGGGGGVFRLSLLLSVMVKPRSPLSCTLTLGKKWVETCWDLTRGLEPILAFPLLLRATNHSRPVLWFLWITEV